MKIKELGEKPLKTRIIYFVIVLIFWFFIANQINSSYEDSIEKASNLRTLWILSGIVIAGLWIIFFPKKKKDIENKSE